MVSTKILGSMTVFNIENNNKCLLSSISVYYYDFWRSCDTEDWSNDAENTALITEINYILTDIHIENSYFKLLIIFHNFTIFTVFLSIRVFFQKINIYIYFFFLSVIFTDSLVQLRLKTEKKRKEKKRKDKKKKWSCTHVHWRIQSKRILNWVVYWIIKDKQLF